MPKLFTVQIEVPSGSRTGPFKEWLNRLLTPHRMTVTSIAWSEEEDQRHFSKENRG